ncbi:MAG: DUF4920 domain-containing protein [Bacteroidetes bacterium]|nr:MAG: DUF4920 domain-containing protein [Bacteroidota bacterium]
MLFAALWVGCNRAQTPADVSADEMAYFGEKITPDGAVTWDELLKQLEGQEKLTTKVTGTVTSVCQVKGCWMVISSETPGQPDLFVKFKDYGFFMPKNISGRKVIMEGEAYTEVTPVDELRHYAEDEGKSPEEIAAITEPETQYKFMASGVILLPEDGVN